MVLSTCEKCGYFKLFLLALRYILKAKKIGFKNYLWFFFILRADEFSDKLDLGKHFKKYHDLKKLAKQRERAHIIDDILFNK